MQEGNHHLQVIPEAHTSRARLVCVWTWFLRQGLGRGGGWTQAPCRSDSGICIFTWDLGTGGQDRRPPPPEAWTRKSLLPRSRRWVAAESTPVISQGGRQVISLALNLLLNAARCPCLTEPGHGDRPGTCVRKSNWNAAERNRSGKQMLQLPEALISPEYERVCWGGAVAGLLNVMVSPLLPFRHRQVQW